MPNGRRHVPCARAIASLKSAAVSSSQWTDGLFCGEGDCAQTSEAHRALMENSHDLCTCPPVNLQMQELPTMITLPHYGVTAYKSPARYLNPLSTATVTTVCPEPISLAICRAP